MSNMNIVDRVVERIQKQPLGDLITEEDLYDIVKEAIPKAFFEPRKSNDGYRNIEQEPVILSIMRECLRAGAKAAIDSWMVENSEKVAAYWKKVMDDTLLAYVQQIQSEQANGHIKNALFTWIQQINRERANAGLQMLQI